MSKIRMLCRSLPGAFLLSLLPAAAGAVEHEIQILLDLDNDAGTGCLVNTVEGPFDGVEQILITTVETTSPPEAGTVTEVATSDCVDEVADTFGPPVPFDGLWDVGIDNGVGGRDVVETYVPLLELVVPEPTIVRLGVVVTDELGGEQALLTEDGSPDGPPILLDLRSLLEIPTLGEWGLILLALLLAAASLRLMGRRGTAALAVALLLLATGVAWAAANLDGLTDDWFLQDQLASNGIVLFGKQVGDDLCFRVDLDLLFNAPPVAEPDAFTTDEDTVLAGENVLADNGSGADSDPNSDPLTVTAFDVVSAQGAAVTVAPNGDLTYDPTGVPALQALDDGESVDDTFTYTIEDPSGASDTATVTVTVDGVNDAPTALDDEYETDEDVPLNVPAPGVLVNDDDVDASDTITAVLDSGPTSSDSFTLNPDGSFSYTPAMDFNGTDSFTYHAFDGTASSPTVTATITVGPVNDGPNAVDDDFATGEDTVLNIADPGVLTNDTDPETDPLTVTGFDAVSAEGATVSVNPGGGFSYDPTGAPDLQALAAAETVDDTFTYTVEDPGGEDDTATVTVTVTGVDDPPVAVDDAPTVTEDDPGATILVLANDTDVDGGPISVASVTQPDFGSVANNTTHVTYTPDPNYCNDGVTTDDFEYTLSPGGDVGLVQVTVTCVNDPPVADDETITAACNLEHVVETAPGESAAATSPIFRTIADNVLVGDSDPVEGTAISIVQADGLTSDTTAPFDITTNEGGTVTLHADGSFTYTPEGGDRSVADSFTYTIQDADGGQDTATVNLNVGATCVWFVDNSNNGGADDTGDGTSSDPFTSLVDEIGPDADPDDAEDASAAGDVIYVFEGNSTTGDPYQGDFVADADQKLLGQGVDLVVDFGSGPETLFTGNPANRPLIDDTDGDAVQVTDVTGVEIAGFQLQAADNVLQVTSTTAAAGVHFHDNEVLGSGAEAIDLNPGSSGAFTATIEDNVFATASATGNAIDVTTGAGNTAAVEVAISGNTDITSSAGTGINLNGTLGTGTLFVTGFADNSVHGNSGGAGVMATDVTFDADPGDPDFDEVAAGTWSIGESGNPVATSGMYLGTTAMEVEGHLSFTQLDIYAAAGAGLDVAGAGLFGGGSPGTGFQLEIAAGTIVATGGPAVTIDPATVGLTFSSITSTGSPTTGVSLVDVAGTFSAGAGSAITGAVGTSFNVSGGTPAVTYGGTITHGSNGSRAVEIQSMTGGSASFGGAVSATDGTGIRIADNTGTNPIAFTSTVDLGTSGSRISDGTALSMTGNSAGTSVTAPDVDVFTSGQTAVNASGSGLLDVDALSISTVSNGRALDLDGIRSLVDVDSVTCSHNSNCVDLTSLAASSTTTFADADLTCTGGTCFNASSARTVEVTGAGNTISATGAVGLNMTNTTIGANDVTWESISASGAANGIVLDTTGTTGDFTVTGDGTLARNGSGGVLATTIGANLNAAHGVALRQMNFMNNGDHAVEGSGGSDHVLSAVTIQNPTNHGWEATDLQGVNRIDEGSLVTQFNGVNQDGVRLINTDTDFTSFTVDNVTFSSSATGNDGFFHRALGGTSGSIVVTDSTFTGLDADGVQVANDGSETIVTTIQGNAFTTADATGGDGNNGLALNLGGSGIHQFLVGGANAGDENTFTTVNRLGDNSGVINVTAAGAGTGSTSQVIGTIQRNTISDSDGRRGISVLFEASGGTGHGGHTIVIDNNSVNDVAREGIYVGMSSVAGRSNTGNKITISNNNVGDVSVVSTAGNREGIEIEAFHDGAGGGSIEADILVEDNVAVIGNTDETFRVTNDAFTLGGAATTTLDVTVLGNTFTNNDASGDSFEHRNFDAGSTSCLDVNAANQAADRNDSNRGYLITRSAGTFGIEGLAAGTHANAAVNTFVDARNDGGASAASGNDFTGGVTCSLP